MEKNPCLVNEVNLKLAEPTDLLEIYNLVDGYDGEERLRFDHQKVKLSLRDMVYLKGVVLAVYKEQIIGGVAGYVLNSIFNDDVLYCAMVLYVKREFRDVSRKVLTEFELSLLPTKVTKIIFGVMDGPKFKVKQRFFKMMGYRFLESHFVKGI